MAYKPSRDDTEARVNALRRRLEGESNPRTRTRLEDEIQYLESGLQTREDEQREIDYWAKQPQTVTFEVTIDQDGAEVSCDANPAGSWLVNKDGDLPGYGIQTPYPVDRDGELLTVETLAEGIGHVVRRMVEAQQDGSELG